MATKSKLGDTKKYAGVVKSVQGASKPKEPEEPRITKDQVIEAFQSFGFTPNERNHNDIAYWTSKGQSEKSKLIEELHNRRKDINDGEDESSKAEMEKHKSRKELEEKQEFARKELEHKRTISEKEFEHKKKLAEDEMAHRHQVGKQAMPRLSDQDLNDLFDEYGLPPPDPEWARNHLPNDPEKVRSILDMQRKTADSMLKKHAKNSINEIPETPKMGGMPGMPPVPLGGPGGMGGPMGAQGDMAMDQGEPATPFFIGNQSLVRIVNPTNPQASTRWLVDSKKKVLRPFISDEAFRSAFEDPDAAEKAMVTISSRELGESGALKGFKPLQGDMGVQHDGSMKDIPFTDAQLQNRYGKPQDVASEDRALSMLDGLFGHMTGKQGGQPQ